MTVKECSNPEQWRLALQSLPAFPGKAYYQPEYYQLLAENNEGKPTALAYYRQNQLFAFYPFLLKAVPASLTTQNLFDIESGYGYGGPCFAEPSDEAAKTFTRLQSEWCAQNGVVAEFVRFNPLTGNHGFLQNFYRLEKNRKTIQINTDQDISQVLQQASPLRRRNFRKAQKAGLVYRQCSMNDFKNLYRQTMNKLNADAYYYFSEAYFTSLEHLLEHNAILRAAFDNKGRLAAAAVFLTDAQSFHYHLGASDQQLQALRPNDFLMLKVAQEAVSAGKKLLHLGGGRSLAEDDSLFRFKKGFAPQTLDFFTGKRIYSPDTYQQLSEKWQSFTGRQPKILLHYHYGV
jgi:hypothetical protein